MLGNYWLFVSLIMIIGWQFVVVKRLNEIIDILNFIKHQNILDSLYRSIDKEAEALKTKVKSVKVKK